MDIYDCDYGCAAANNCEVGGIECEGCGDSFCAFEINEEGYCERCAKEREEEEKEEMEEVEE